MNYTSDFETTTDINDCRVWAWGICDIETYDFQYGNTIESFIDFVLENNKHNNNTYYFHNLKFDGQFILDYLAKNGYKLLRKNDDIIDDSVSTLISKMGQFYSIKINIKTDKKKPKFVEFRDSLKKLPFSVEKVAQTFNLPIKKLEIDYTKYREKGHILTEQEIAYLKNDVLIMAMALKIQFSQNLLKMTIGSDALNNYKAIITNKKFNYYFPILSVQCDSFIRKSYRGGIAQVNKKIISKDVGKGLIFDVNSLYPSVMYECGLPIGTPIYFEGKYKKNESYPLHISRVLLKCKIRKNHIPTLQIKNTFRYNPVDFIEELIDYEELYLTSVDLELIKEQYIIEDIIYLDGYMFRKEKGIFKDYIDYWINIKSKSKGGVRQLSKLMLNSLYGKFATNPDITVMYPYLEDDIVKYRLDEKEERDPVYTAVGSFITAYARAKLVRAIQANYDRFLYCDTDSIHILGYEEPNEIEVHDTKLGAWKCEGKFTRARYLKPKSYIEEIDGKLLVKCSGMTDVIKEDVTWENFKIGFTSDKKLRPRKVKGGVVLENTTFTIK